MQDGRMAVRKIETFLPVTMALIRGRGCRDLLVLFAARAGSITARPGVHAPTQMSAAGQTDWVKRAPRQLVAACASQRLPQSVGP
jgi:hypothetical protein